MAQSEAKNFKLDYWNLLRSSFNVVKVNRSLWWLGIFAGGATGIPNIFNYKTDIENFESSATVRAADGFVPPETEVMDWLSSNWQLVLGAGILAGALLIAFLVLSVMAKSGIINSFLLLKDNKKSSFKDGLKFGYGKFWKTLGLGLLTVLIFVVAALALVAPIAFLAYQNLTVLWAIVGSIIFLLIIFTLAVTFEFGLRYLVVNEQGVIHSMKSGLGFVRTNKKEAVISWLVALLASFAGSFLIGIAALVLGLALVAIGALIYLTGFVPALIYGGVAALILFVLAMIAAGFLNAVISGYWTLLFQEVEKQPKN